MKNQDLKVDIIGDHLKDKRIALCITGGIAAIETPKIARHLRRYGADVKAYLTSEAQKFVGPSALEWATEQPIVTELSGMSEHIFTQDLVLVCPATLNTINKIFAGIADNAVTTLIASSLGYKKPIYLVPTMHESLFENPFLKENLQKAERYGMHIIEPRVSEGKKKIPKLENIVAEVCKELSEHPIKGKRLLVTGGPTPARIDDVRVITNIFKGNLAKAIADEAYLRGADVKLLLGDTGIDVPSYIDSIYHHDIDEYIANVFSELEKGYDAGVFSAAVADYKPVNVAKGKIPSKGALKELKFIETPKVIQKVREQYPDLYMVTFKLESGISEAELLAIADNRIKQGYHIVIANRLEDMKNGHKAYVVGEKGLIYEAHSKQDIAKKLIDILGESL